MDSFANSFVMLFMNSMQNATSSFWCSILVITFTKFALIESSADQRHLNYSEYLSLRTGGYTVFICYSTCWTLSIVMAMLDIFVALRSRRSSCISRSATFPNYFLYSSLWSSGYFIYSNSMNSQIRDAHFLSQSGISLNTELFKPCLSNL